MTPEQNVFDDHLDQAEDRLHCAPYQPAADRGGNGVHQRLVTIDAIHPERARYDTDGDWTVDPDRTLRITVTANMPRREQMLLALHELVEALLCGERGITQAQVDAFDMAFTGDGEPGDSTDAPYRKEHRFAALIDHLVAHEMGVVPYGRVDWIPPD